MRQKYITAIFLVVFLSALGAQCATDPPEQYMKFFKKVAQGRSMPTEILSQHGIGDQEIGRSYALIAGISHYPNLPDDKRDLPQAKVDVDRLVSFLAARGESRQFSFVT